MSDSKRPSCGKGCVIFGVLIIMIITVTLVFYEGAPTGADLCKIYG